MLLPMRRPASSSAFTLIELLVVISIIAILMGLLFPAFKGVQDQAKRTQAKNDEQQIITAVNAYFTEYGRMPVDDTKQGVDTLAGNPNGLYDNAYIFNVLRAIPDSNWNSNNKLNARQTVYFNGSNAKDADKPKSGFATKDTTSNGAPIKNGGYVDPWGNEYLVAVDSDYDGWTNDFIPYSDLNYQVINGGQGPRPSVSGSCISSSWGKDTKWGTNGDGKFKGSDDVLSWQ